MLGGWKTARTCYRRAIPLIKGEAQLLSGPLVDFDQFIQQGRHTKPLRKERAWLADEGHRAFHRYRVVGEQWARALDLAKTDHPLDAAAACQRYVELDGASGYPGLRDLAAGLGSAATSFKKSAH